MSNFVKMEILDRSFKNSIDRSIEPDLMVTAIDPSLVNVSKKSLREKLLNFLVVSPPPIPLSFMTFKSHIKAQCQTYYDNVISEVYEFITERMNEHGLIKNENEERRPLPICDLIAISSDDESESEECAAVDPPPVVNGNCDHHSATPPQPNKPCPPPANGDCHNNCATPSQTSCDVSISLELNEEETKAFKGERSTKKYVRYLQETYNLIKKIEKTTSCSICSKLKRRIQKFVSLVGQESAIIQQKVAKELKAHHSGSANFDLEEEKLEKIRMGILIDKLIEISMPDILKSVEMMVPSKSGKSCPEDEHQSQAEDDGKTKQKTRNPSACTSDVIASCSTVQTTVPIAHKLTKRTASTSSSAEATPITPKRRSHPLNESCVGNEEDKPKKRRSSKDKEKKKKFKTEESSAVAPKVKARSYLGNDEDEPKKRRSSSKEKEKKKKSKKEEPSAVVPKVKARKISVKVKDVSHADRES